jgi:hypothetical protein
MAYFMISNDDGDTYIEEIDPGKLLKDISNGDYGDEPTFLDKMPDKSPNYWPECSYLIIKGEIVAPRPVQIVTEYRIE